MGNQARIIRCAGCNRWFDTRRRRFRKCIECGGVGPLAEEPSNRGWIYFITEGEATDFVKIGTSKYHPDARVKQLQVGNPRKLVLRLCRRVDSATHTEGELHALFASDRVEGEWFRFSSEIQAFIADVESQLTPPSAVQ